MHAFIAIVRKDLTLLLRDKTGFFFTLIFPLLMAVFFGAVFSGGAQDSKAIGIVVVDKDSTTESRAFIETISKATELSVRLDTEAKAKAEVGRGQTTAYLVLPKGFGQARKRVFWGTPATVLLGVDPARRAEASMLEGIVTRYLMEGFQEVLSSSEARMKVIREARKDLNGADAGSEMHAFVGKLESFLSAIPAASDRGSKSAGWSPASIEVVSVVREGKRPASYFAISFPQGIAWGLMMCAMTFAMGLVTERTQGTLMRLRVAPISRSLILFGKAGACFVMVVAIQLGLFAVGYLAFGLELGPPLLIAATVFSTAVCFVGIMLLFSVLGRTEKAASGYATAIMLVMMMIGGGMIPLFIMPAWMQAISHVSPVKWAVVALEGSTWRGFELSDLLIPYGVLIATGVACFMLGRQLFQDA